MSLTKRFPNIYLGQVLVVTLAVFPMLFSLAISRGINRDEHQHIAAGVLWARHSLLPYSGYPWFHTPYLPLIYGWLFRLTGWPLLTGRCVSVLCASGTAGLLFATAWEAFEGLGAVRRQMAIAAVVLFLGPPLFTYGLGFAWNEEPSVFLAVVAVVFLNAAAEFPRRLWYFLAGGIALGFSIGVRSTMAPLVAPLGWHVLTVAGDRGMRSRLVASAVFTLGVIVALLPAFLICWQAPGAAWFGLAGFASANLRYLQALRTTVDLGWLQRTSFFAQQVLHRMAVLVVLTTGMLVAGRIYGKRIGGGRLKLALLTLPFLLLGSLAPTPLHLQYFCAELPFLILIVIYAAAHLRSNPKVLRIVALVALSVALLSMPFNYRPYVRGLRALPFPSRWEPVVVHRLAQKIKIPGGKGRILTLDPIFPLEGGLDIYPALATGVFAWRVAPFVPADVRSLAGMQSPENLEEWMRREPPAAILVGNEHHYEQLLREYAVAHGYRRELLAYPRRDLELWLPPLPKN